MHFGWPHNSSRMLNDVIEKIVIEGIRAAYTKPISETTDHAIKILAFKILGGVKRLIDEGSCDAAHACDAAHEVLMGLAVEAGWQDTIETTTHVDPKPACLLYNCRCYQ